MMNEWSLRGAFTMQTKVQKSRASRNPKTSEKVITDEKKKILFKMSQEIFNEINDL